MAQTPFQQTDAAGLVPAINADTTPTGTFRQLDAAGKIPVTGLSSGSPTDPATVISSAGGNWVDANLADHNERVIYNYAFGVSGAGGVGSYRAVPGANAAAQDANVKAGVNYGVSPRQGSYTGDVLDLAMSAASILPAAASGTRQSWASLTLPAGFVNPIIIDAPDEMTAVDASAVSVPGGTSIAITGGAALATIVLPTSLTDAVTTVDLSGNALPPGGAGGIDALLATILASCTSIVNLDISGGANSTPGATLTMSGGIPGVGNTWTRTANVNGHAAWTDGQYTLTLNAGATTWTLTNSGADSTATADGGEPGNPTLATGWSSDPTFVWAAGTGIVHYATIAATCVSNGGTAARNLFP